MLTLCSLLHHKGDHGTKCKSAGFQALPHFSGLERAPEPCLCVAVIYSVAWSFYASCALAFS